MKISSFRFAAVCYHIQCAHKSTNLSSILIEHHDKSKSALWETGSGKRQEREHKIFSEELKQTKLSNFQPISDMGYFAWNPKDHPYKSLTSIKSANEIVCYIDYDGMPDRLQSLQQMETPKRFQYPASNAHENKFPFGELDIAYLHVATKVSTICIYIVVLFSKNSNKVLARLLLYAVQI